VTSSFNPSLTEKKSMYLKIHETPKGRIVAACDKELIGKILDDGEMFLDIQTHKNFYAGSLANAFQLKKALSSFASANLVGKRAVSVALEMGLTVKESVIYINKTPHIQLYRI